MVAEVVQVVEVVDVGDADGGGVAEDGSDDLEAVVGVAVDDSEDLQDPGGLDVGGLTGVDDVGPSPALSSLPSYGGGPQSIRSAGPGLPGPAGVSEL